jgi:hypothetical protein
MLESGLVRDLLLVGIVIVVSIMSSVKIIRFLERRR